MKKTLWALFAVVLLSTACKKDKDEPETPTVENLKGTYKLTMVTENGVNVFNNSNASLNYYEACERDDIYILKDNGTYDYVDQGTLCSGSNNFTGSWSLVSSTVVNFNGFPYTIKSWNGTTLVVTITDQGTTEESTYVKQ